MPAFFEGAYGDSQGRRTCTRSWTVGVRTARDERRAGTHTIGRVSDARPVSIEGVLRRYEWGSRTAIPRLLGVEPDGRPAAELWFGAHPHDPSPAPAHQATLEELIAADPNGMLGAPTVERFGPRLPYLVKILAAGKALSIQVHPTREQAQEGYAREEAAGIAHDAPNRNYRDPNHKPELLYALTPFEALCGFRPVDETLALLAQLDVPELAFVAELLRGPDPLRAAFTALLTHDEPGPIVAAVAARAGGAAGDEGPLHAVRVAGADAPEDVGVVVALLLNYVRLAPGEAIFLGAGNVHAYLRGAGVEIMANSDNVLRCGLTPKHVDVAELLRITDFLPLPEPRWPAVGGRFDVPVPDFALTRVALDEPTGLDEPGPCIAVCTSGGVVVGDVDLRPGHAAFVPAGIRTTISGVGEVFVASVGL
jgi:mannose-6-phosphate isomerase